MVIFHSYVVFLVHLSLNVSQRVNPVKSHTIRIFLWFSYGFPMISIGFSHGLPSIPGRFPRDPAPSGLGRRCRGERRRAAAGRVGQRGRGVRPARAGDGPVVSAGGSWWVVLYMYICIHVYVYVNAYVYIYSIYTYIVYIYIVYTYIYICDIYKHMYI